MSEVRIPKEAVDAVFCLLYNRKPVSNDKSDQRLTDDIEERLEAAYPAIRKAIREELKGELLGEDAVLAADAAWMKEMDESPHRGMYFALQAALSTLEEEENERRGQGDEERPCRWCFGEGAITDPSGRLGADCPLCKGRAWLLADTPDHPLNDPQGDGE